MTEIQTLTRAVISGEIRRVLFDSGDGRYAVLRLADGSGAEHVLCGPLCGLAPGQNIEAEGHWEKHAEFGHRFRAERFRLRLPSTPEGIKRFLGSGAIPGIGGRTAEIIVDHFGAETLTVLDRFSKRLREVPGIGPKKAEAIIQGWRESAARRESYIFLQGLGVTPVYCDRLFRQYGEQAPQMVRANPYRLAEEVDGIGFLKADEIAGALGIARDSVDRMAAACVHTVNLLVASGHVCCPEQELLRQTAELAGQERERALAGLEAALQRGMLRRADGMIYTPLLLRAETELPKLVASLATARRFAGQSLRPLPGPAQLTLNEGQRAAVEAVARAPLSIITGGPGVGKTTVVGEIVRRARAAKVPIALAAPTGRAAKRLSESTGITAKTLHRLLQFDPATGHFVHGAASPLSCRLLIVDEVSMLDLLLAQALFRALRPGTSVVLVGDADQLPSVGAGTVLASFLSSGWFRVTALTQIFRQAENSRIIVNAHRVNCGQLPENLPLRPGELTDFYWIEQDDPDRAVELIEKMVVERIPARFRLDPVNDVQILTPMNRGSCGTVALNARMQALLNGGDRPQFKLGERIYRTGDKIMQISNNYEKNVFNGDFGRLGRIHFKEKKFLVLFDDGRVVEYRFEEAEQLSPAYAVTVHKSQGSEFPAVVLPFLTQHYMMLQRNLLYTAMTRAKRLLVLIGSVRAVRMAVENARLEPRFSLLSNRLTELRQRCEEAFRSAP